MLQKDSNRASLGEFVVDLEQGLLFLNGEEISVEPKVMELLLYLYHCRGRYVTVEELHEHVWADRVVTDTAVRGTVKKLRVALRDDDLHNPKYVKSVAKRGYKLICESSILDESHDETLTTTIEEPDAAASISDRVTQPKSNKQRYLIWFTCAVIVAMTCIYVAIQHSSSRFDFIGEKLLTEYKGEKKSVAVSSDGRFVAFTGRNLENELSQVYLLDNQDGSVRQLTTKATNARFVSFAQNDKVLLFSDTVTGASSLKLLPLTVSDPESAMITLFDEQYLISGIQPGRVPSEVIVQLANKAESRLMIYAVDLETLQKTRLVAPSHSDQYIWGGTVSPDKKKLMTIVMKPDSYQLVILNFESQQERVLSETSAQVHGAVWLNDEQILMLDRDALNIVDVHTGAMQVVLQNQGDLITDIAVDNNGGVVAIKKSQVRADRLYIERSFADAGAVSRVIDTAPEVTSMMFDPENENMRWVRIKKNNINYIAHLNINTEQQTIHYETKKRLELLDSAPNNKYLLVKEGHRLAIFSIENNHIHYLTADSGLSSDGVFSHNGEEVFFGVQVAGEWEIQRFNISTSTIDVFLRGYMSIRPSKSGFIAADGNGDLYHLDSSLAVLEAMKHRIGLQLITRWHVKQNSVIWSDYDYLKSYVHHVDLVTQKHTVIEDLFLSMYPRTSADQLGEHIVYLSVQINNSAIQQLYFE
ncbi:hypothetical protein N483_27010 [Pseudoalteromonas luteoviolacea NCIMB 1944]|nr:hypothetical protein N483_27010 [Pseudoalteromonas luteoviolacea NCIMB 1944]